MRKDASDALMLDAALTAANTIESIYKYIDLMEAAGGLDTFQGRVQASKLILSLQKNRGRLHELVLTPLREAIRIKAS